MARAIWSTMARGSWRRLSSLPSRDSSRLFFRVFRLSPSLQQPAGEAQQTASRRHRGDLRRSAGGPACAYVPISIAATQKSAARESASGAFRR